MSKISWKKRKKPSQAINLDLRVIPRQCVCVFASLLWHGYGWIDHILVTDNLIDEIWPMLHQKALHISKRTIFNDSG